MGLSAIFGCQHWGVCQPGSLTLLRVVVQHWIIAATFAAPAVAAALLMRTLISQADRLVVVPFIVGYALFEVTAFCIERNWSQISFVRFWMIAGPMNICMAVLCYFVAGTDAEGCALLSCLCFGVREGILQMIHGTVGGNLTKHRVAAAITRGCAFSAIVGILCGIGFVTIRWVQDGIEAESTLTFCLASLAFLPISKILLRLLTIHSSGYARLQEVGFEEKGIAHGMKSSGTLDVLVAFCDVAYAMGIMLEIPYVFALLLAPSTHAFCFAAVFGMVLDMSFPCALESLRPTSTSLSAQALQRTPTYCIERPAPFFAALTSSPLSDSQPSERSHLKPPRVQNKLQNVDAMSPRVSMLYDEFDRTLIGCHRARSMSDATSGTHVLAMQELKLALTSHAAAATAASVISILLVSYHVASHQLHSDWAVTIRFPLLVLLRIVGDAVACWIAIRAAASDNVEGSLERVAAELIWEGPRLEFASLAGWLNKALISCCATLPAIAAAHAWS